MITSSIITLIFTRGQSKEFEGMPRTYARGRGRDRGQFFEAESKDKILASRSACPRGLNIAAYVSMPCAIDYL